MLDSSLHSPETLLFLLEESDVESKTQSKVIHSFNLFTLRTMVNREAENIVYAESS